MVQKKETTKKSKDDLIAFKDWCVINNIPLLGCVGLQAMLNCEDEALFNPKMLDKEYTKYLGTKIFKEDI